MHADAVWVWTSIAQSGLTTSTRVCPPYSSDLSLVALLLVHDFGVSIRLGGIIISCAAAVVVNTAATLVVLSRLLQIGDEARYILRHYLKISKEPFISHLL